MITNVLISAVATLSTKVTVFNDNIQVNYAPIVITERYYYNNPVLEIPKVNLKKEVFPNDLYLNNVDRNIQVISGSSMPNVTHGNLILASHSGSSSIAYFKHLDMINYNDVVYVYYKDKKYKYVIGEIYDVPKTGYVEIKRRRELNAVTLITCKKGTNMQTVYIGYLVSLEKTP